MKYILIALFSLFSFITNTNHNKTAANKPFVVLQLFTSQGCSSCPRADDFLEEVKENYANKNVIVMSYHVDYWNSLGWQDPFSKKEFSNLQYSYAKQLQTRSVYTPQVVVNGKVHYVGSNKNKIKSSIAENLSNTPKNNVTFSNLKKEGTKISFDYAVAGITNDKKLQVTLVLENKITKVKRGENTNRTISNSNIVINTATLSIDNTTGTTTITVPENYKNETQLRVIGFVQNTDLHITGATQLKV